jgi:dihydrolipoamide dehydrogenase
MSNEVYDAIVLGGGPGGYVCAIRLAQLGLKTACVEAEQVGGVCLNWGCIPSKALISNAHTYYKAKHGADQGLRFGEVSIDVAAMQRWKDGIVHKLTSGVRALFKSNGVTLIEGHGRFVAVNQLEVKALDGSSSIVEASNGVIVATGSATIQVPGFEFDYRQVIGAREAVSLDHVPARLLVVGGGVIGLELGMVYQALGSELTIVELTNSLLPGIDPDAVRIVERKIVSRGGRVYKGARAEGYSREEDGHLSVKLIAGGNVERVECDTVLVAVGMRPQSRGIGLEELGVLIDERGFVRTDEKCRTNVAGIFAIGDVSGGPMLAHKASKEGEVCAEVIAGKAAAKDWVTVPGIVFTDPEIAAVGLTEEQAKQQGIDVKTGRFPFSALGRAMSLGETDGFCKIVSDQATRRVLGVHICGPNASDLISEAALALEMGATAEDLALTIHPHPTLGEAMMEASAAALGHAIHIANR